MARCRRCPTQLTGRAKVCDSCKAGTTPPQLQIGPASSEAQTPQGLDPRGRDLWKTLGQTVGTPAGELALEACRIADRLTKLDALLRGDRWVNLLRVDEDEDTKTIVVVVDKAMAEARGQQATLLAILTKLGIEAKGGVEPAGEASPLAQVIALVQSASKHQGRSS